MDLVDVKRALTGFDPAETMFIIVSKTFTTWDTLVNEKKVRRWLRNALEGDEAVVRQNVVD